MLLLKKELNNWLFEKHQLLVLTQIIAIVYNSCSFGTEIGGSSLQPTRIWQRYFLQHSCELDVQVSDAGFVEGHLRLLGVFFFESVEQVVHGHAQIGVTVSAEHVVNLRGRHRILPGKMDQDEATNL